MTLTQAGRLVPESLRVGSKEAARIAEGARWNQKALAILKEHSFNPARIKQWIANNNPDQQMVEALRRVYREVITSEAL